MKKLTLIALLGTLLSFPFIGSGKPHVSHIGAEIERLYPVKLTKDQMDYVYSNKGKDYKNKACPKGHVLSSSNLTEDNWAYCVPRKNLDTYQTGLLGCGEGYANIGNNWELTGQGEIKKLRRTNAARYGGNYAIFAGKKTDAVCKKVDLIGNQYKISAIFNSCDTSEGYSFVTVELGGKNGLQVCQKNSDKYLVKLNIFHRSRSAAATVKLKPFSAVFLDTTKDIALNTSPYSSQLNIKCKEGYGYNGIKAFKRTSKHYMSTMECKKGLNKKVPFYYAGNYHYDATGGRFGTGKKTLTGIKSCDSGYKLEAFKHAPSKYAKKDIVIDYECHLKQNN